VAFIHMHWKQHHWPTFNVADMAIVAGIGLVLLDAFLHRRPPEAPARKGTRK
jgi:signal peptidase II